MMKEKDLDVIIEDIKMFPLSETSQPGETSETSQPGETSETSQPAETFQPGETSETVEIVETVDYMPILNNGINIGICCLIALGILAGIIFGSQFWGGIKH